MAAVFTWSNEIFHFSFHFLGSGYYFSSHLFSQTSCSNYYRPHIFSSEVDKMLGWKVKTASYSTVRIYSTYSRIFVLTWYIFFHFFTFLSEMILIWGRYGYAFYQIHTRDICPCDDFQLIWSVLIEPFFWVSSPNSTLKPRPSSLIHCMKNIRTFIIEKWLNLDFDMEISIRGWWVSMTDVALTYNWSKAFKQ